MSQQAEISSLIAQIEAATSQLDRNNLSTLVEKLSNLTRSRGTDQDTNRKLYELVLNGSVDSISLNLSILDSIYPITPLEPSLIAFIVPHLASETSPSRPHLPYEVQRRLLEQLAALCEIGHVSEEGKEMLRNLYRVLEKGLKFRSLCEPTAVLLLQIAERWHVTPSKLKDLNLLIATFPTESSCPALLGLRWLYERFLNPSTSAASLSLFKRDGVWRLQLEEVIGSTFPSLLTSEVSKWGENLEGIVSSGRQGQGEGEEGGIDSTASSTTKRRKLSLPTEIHGTSALRSDLDEEQREFDVKHFIDQLIVRESTLEIVQSNLPPSLRRYEKTKKGSEAGANAKRTSMKYNNEEEQNFNRRIVLEKGSEGHDEFLQILRNELSEICEEERICPTDDRFSDGDLSSEILKWLLRTRELGGEFPSELFEIDFASFLDTTIDAASSSDPSDGRDDVDESYRKLGFKFFSLLPPTISVEDLRTKYLDPLERLVQVDTIRPEWFVDCIEGLTRLIENWGARDDLESVNDEERSTSSEKDLWINEGNGSRRTLQHLLDYTDALIEHITCRFPDSLAIRSASLTFYEQSLDLPLERQIAVVVVPSPTFAYLALLSSEAMCVSRICGIVARLREALTGTTTALNIDDPIYTAPINALNGLLLDFGNPLWKKQFLTSTPIEDGGAGMELSDLVLRQISNYAEKREQTAQSSLGVTTHGALAVFAREYVDVLANERGKSSKGFVGPVTATSLKALSKKPKQSVDLSEEGPSSTIDEPLKINFNEFRPLLIDHLRLDRGMNGIEEFLYSSIQSLMKRRQETSTTTGEREN